VELNKKAYCDAALIVRTIFEWHKRFQEGRESVKDDKRRGRPTTSRTYDNIAAVAKMVEEDRNLTSRLTADKLGITKTVVLLILRVDLKKLNLCSRFFPPAHHRPGPFGSKNLTVSDSKTSRNIGPPPYSPDLSPPPILPLHEGDIPAEGCKIWYN
jgi:hypothetical protein